MKLISRANGLFLLAGPTMHFAWAQGETAGRSSCHLETVWKVGDWCFGGLANVIHITDVDT
ncbi:MAG: hypothetical protein HEQ16_03960 [Bosea sp.]|nr:hypothetical protein [Bosea sp. (in: a-proteobacteria)]